MGLPYRILNINHKKELLRGLWVNPRLVYVVSRFEVIGTPKSYLLRIESFLSMMSFLGVARRVNILRKGLLQRFS